MDKRTPSTRYSFQDDLETNFQNYTEFCTDSSELYFELNRSAYRPNLSPTIKLSIVMEVGMAKCNSRTSYFVRNDMKNVFNIEAKLGLVRPLIHLTSKCFYCSLQLFQDDSHLFTSCLGFELMAKVKGNIA